MNETLGDSATSDPKMPSGSQAEQGPAHSQDSDHQADSQMYKDLLKDASDLEGTPDLIPRDLTITAWTEEDQLVAFAKESKNGEHSQEKDRTFV